MPLLPIDQQAMFTHLDNVGKEQVAQKQGVNANQAQQAAELVKKAEQAGNSITETKNVDEETEKINDKKKKQTRQLKDKRKKKEQQGVEEEQEQEVFKDPDLGHHIDITG